MGDVNGDSKTDIDDVTNLITSLITGDISDNGFADVNLDGIVDISDITEVINILLNAGN